MNRAGQSLDRLYETSPGMVGTIAGYINRTAERRQPAFALANALAFWGAVIGRKVETTSEARTNLYAIGVGESGCGKDHSRKIVKRICKAAGLTAELLGGEDLTSDSAILSALTDQPSQLFQIDEVGHFLGGLTSRNATPAHRTIAPTLTKLFSSSNTLFIGKQFADSRLNARRDIDQPNACLYGTTVPCRLTEAISVDQITDGFLPRILIFLARDNSPRRDRSVNTREPVPDAIVEAVRAWWDFDGMGRGEGNIAEVIEREPVVVPFSGDAESQLDAFGDHCDQRRDELRGEAGRDVLWTRAYEHALKVALTVSASRPDESLAIRSDDAEWAIELVGHLITGFDQLIQDNVSENAVEAMGKRVLKIIRDAGRTGIARSDLTRRTQWLDHRQRQNVLMNLAEGGAIGVTEERTRGRTAARYVALPSTGR